MKVFYDRVFAYGSLQFCGHIEEYLADHTTDLMIFIVQPRIGAHVNLLRRYHAGHRVEERRVRSSQIFFLCYLLWYVTHVREVLRFCPKRQKTLILGGHPLVFFGMGVLKRLRPLVYAYWIGDYFPPSGPVIRLYEWVKKHYHDRVTFAFYLSDAINRIMNGSVVNTPYRRTVMWGMKPFPAMSAPPLSVFSLLFVGLVRPGQGLEQLFEFLSQHREYRMQLIGVCPAEYYARLQTLITRLDLQQQVFFPNRFYSESELLAVARTCHVGLALYDTSVDNFTHYADPGKVKAYAEMRLPVVMTRISDIVPFVERFGSGVVIDGYSEIGEALDHIRMNYARYLEGVERFISNFEFETYYRNAFRAMEES
jgi:glycosyltransferase involved in cell wall biosynthesis